jgi:hypothetical protein
MDIKQIMFCFIGMISSPAWSRKLSISEAPKGGAEGAEIDSEGARQATIGLP